MSSTKRAIVAAKIGLVINILLAFGKFFLGLVGHSHALMADGVESATDIISSLVVWGGLSVAAVPADDDHPFGHGRAESIAAAVVSLILLGVGLLTGIVAVHEMWLPGSPPSAFTLFVFPAVIVIKELLFRYTVKIGRETDSHIVKTDAWHHRSDVLSSAAAFIGISVAIIGGPAWSTADDWAAVVAAFIIAYNAVQLLGPAVDELMDRAPNAAILENFRSIARSVPGVRNIEKLKVRKMGARYHVEIHVQVDPALSIHEAHIIGGKVKSAFRSRVPAFLDCNVHLEPFEE